MHLDHNTQPLHYNLPVDAAIRVAQSAVNETRRLLRNGIGNQRASILSTGGASAEETTRARSSYIPDPNPIIWIAQQAISAIRAGAGNCDENGAVAFCLLHCWHVGPISFAQGIGHTFALIHAGQNGVLVDPWAGRAEEFRPTEAMFQVQTYWTVNQPASCLIQQYGNMVADFEAMEWSRQPNNPGAQYLASLPHTY